MTQEVFLELVRWLQENYHCTPINWKHLESPPHNIKEITFNITETLQLSIKAEEADVEDGLIDYKVILETSYDVRMTITNINFCAYESNAERVIEHIEDMLARHCMALLPSRMIVYQAR